MPDQAKRHPYQKQPRGNNSDPRIMPFARCWDIACNHPDAALRRVAIRHYPTILDTWIESGMDRRTIAAVLGFTNYNALRFWLWDIEQLDAFQTAYRDAADIFFEAAHILELVATGMKSQAFDFVSYRYGHISQRDLLRMAGRNNPDKYTGAGKLRDTPDKADGVFSTVKFTGAFVPCAAA